MLSILREFVPDAPFTDRVHRIMSMALDDAKDEKKNYVGAEHILLAVVREGGSAVAILMKEMGIDLATVRSAIFSHSRESGQVTWPIPLHASSKKAILRSVAEAQLRGASYIGSEHVVLALLYDQELVAGRVLTSFGLEYSAFRAKLYRRFGHGWFRL
ncbi:MAG: Clp protease N-terminal domain-containing protein [Pirellulales bacterium]